MNKKTLAIVFVLIGVAALVVWLATGGELFTMTQIPVEVTDELFGTTSTKWEDGFRLGLEIAGPIAGVCFAIAGLLFWRHKKDLHARTI